MNIVKNYVSICLWLIEIGVLDVALLMMAYLVEGPRTIALGKNCPPIPKLTLTLTLTGSQISSGTIVSSLSNPKTNPNLEPNPNPNQGQFSLGRAVFRIP